MIPLTHYQLLAALLFCVGLAGVLTRRNALVALLSLELMLNAVNLSLVAFARERGADGGTYGHGIVVLAIALAAAEAALGLAIILALFRHRGTVDVDAANTMKG